jgi:hypothetical protein
MKQITILSTVIISSVLLFGCGGNSTNTATNGNVATNGNSNNPLETKSPTPEQTVNAAPTLTPMFKAYCAAMDRKDESGIKKLYSADTLKSFDEQMKAEGIKSLVKFLENDKLGAKCEIRNEQITGDTAVAEIRGDSYPNGIKAIFVKENGEWKLTNRSPALDNMKPSTSTSTTTNVPDVKTSGDKK